MNLGIVFPSYIEAWKDCERMEACGFSRAWFYDTQLLSDFTEAYEAFMNAADE